MKIHITKQGESIDTITSKYAVSKQDLTGINPHVNLSSNLVPGLKLKIPDTTRAEINGHVENFYPNLDHEQPLREQSIPIDLKPFETTHAPKTNDQISPTTSTNEDVARPTQDTSSTPWGHLGDHTTYLNPETKQHHPWNPSFSSASSYDTRAFLPPMPFPYPYAYPDYDYRRPMPGFGPWFGPGVGFGPGFGPWFGPGVGFGPGWHGGGHFGGHFGGGHYR